MTRKLNFIGRRGAPDRLVIVDGEVWFVELKKPKNGRLSLHQKKEIADIVNVGGNVCVLTSLKEVNEWLYSIRERIKKRALNKS